MLAQMPATLLIEWMAYDRIDPIGRDRSDLHAALVATAADNAGRVVVSALAGKRAKLAQVADYMPDWQRRARPPMTAKAIYQTFKTALILGGQLRTNGAKGD